MEFRNAEIVLIASKLGWSMGDAPGAMKTSIEHRGAFLCPSGQAHMFSSIPVCFLRLTATLQCHTLFSSGVMFKQFALIQMILLTLACSRWRQEKQCCHQAACSQQRGQEGNSNHKRFLQHLCHQKWQKACKCCHKHITEIGNQHELRGVEFIDNPVNPPHCQLPSRSVLDRQGQR